MSVLTTLSAVAGFFKLPSLVNKVDIDGFVFKAHYKVTAALLIGCSILVSANHLIGESISCVTDGAIPYNVINTFCWISFTYTLPDKLGKDVGTHVAHPGVSTDEEGRIRYHSYYQWVPIMLFFQGIMFYVPHWLWKIWEGGKIRMITDGVPAVSNEPEDRQYSQKRLVQYLTDSLGLHNIYASGYYICEVLNFLNVIGNMFLVDRFLGGEFFSYGINVLKFSQLDQEDRNDPMIAVFPRVTKCTFQKFGPSGTIQSHDALCILALNILNEKIYIILWFWFIILAIISGVQLGYNFALIMLPSFKKRMFLYRFKFNAPKTVPTFIKKTQMGDLLMLNLLRQNLNMLQFNDVLNKLALSLYLEDNEVLIPEMHTRVDSLQIVTEIK